VSATKPSTVADINAAPKAAQGKLNEIRTMLKYYPYVVRSIKRIHEFFILLNPRLYKISEKRGRKSQEKIKHLFLKGHI